MKKKIGDVILQIIPVMIGVYLGFIVSNWSETNKTKSQTELLQNNIIAEIKSNQAKINEVLEYHIMIRDSSRFYQNKIELSKNTSFVKGTRTVTLTNSAFDTGIQTGLINGLGFQEIQALNNIYSLQLAYNNYSDLMMSSLISAIEFQDSEVGTIKFYGILAMTMTDVVLKENQLLQNYVELLEKIKTK